MLQGIEFGIDARHPEQLARFWSAALGYTIGDLDADGVYLDLVPPGPTWPVVYLQRVRDPKVTKNRAHLDLYVDDPRAVVSELTQLGATAIGEPRTGAEGGWWQVMADPEGNEFCICQAR